jgi:T5orf172 domain
VKAKNISEKDLRSDELSFIQLHKISIDEIIDVTGMIRIGQKRAMEAKSARLSINGGGCAKGHRLKTRSNHCPQCDPKNLAFERRHSESAYVYVCESETGLMKIGYAKDPNDRAARLNRESYASCKNWRLIFSAKTENAGRIEFDTHSSLASSKTTETYIKEGREVETYEVFRCSREQAVEAVKRAVRLERG